MEITYENANNKNILSYTIYGDLETGILYNEPEHLTVANTAKVKDAFLQHKLNIKIDEAIHQPDAFTDVYSLILLYGVPQINSTLAILSLATSDTPEDVIKTLGNRDNN